MLKSYKKTKVKVPFNDRARQYIGACFFGYNSPAAITTEFFKPSTDAESLGSIKKKI